MTNYIMQLLQLFGEGAGAAGGAAAAGTGTASGGEGAATGVKGNAAAAEPYAGVKNESAAAEPNAGVKEGQTDAGADSPGQEKGKTAPDASALSEEEINRRVKSIVDKRTASLKNKASEYEKKLATLSPALDLLKKTYKVDPLDAESDALLAERITSDRDVIEKIAMERGVSVEAAQKMVSDELELDRLKAEKKERAEQQRRYREDSERAAAFRGWKSEGEALAQKFPGFDFEKSATENPEFFKMVETLHKNGFSSPVESAFNALNMGKVLEDAMHRAAEEARKQTLDSIRANGMRPEENGTATDTAAAAQRAKKASELTSAEINELIKRSLGGEKIPLGR